MPGEQALQIACEALEQIGATITRGYSQEAFDRQYIARKALTEIAALAAEGGDQESAQSLPSWRIGAPASTWRPMDADALRPSSVLLAVQTDAGRLVGEAHHVVNEDNGRGEWWWAQEGPGDYHAEPIGWPILAWQPLPEPPAPVMAALGAATMAGSGRAHNPSQSEVAGLEHKEAFYTYDPTVDAWYFGMLERAPGPYLEQRHIEAIVDIASDGTLAGVELLSLDALTRTTPSPDPVLGEVVKGG